MIDEKSRQSRSDRLQSVSSQQRPQQQQQPKLLDLGFVHLTGGQDTGGRAVVCFPPRQIIRMHLNSVASPELADIIQYFVSIAPGEAPTASSRTSGQGLAFLADFRACSQSIFRIVIDALDSVQSRSPGSVAVFYALMPRSKELAKSLQKMLGLYQKRSLLPTRKSGPDPNAKSFQSVLLPTSQELYQFVNKANLMSDFGGSLNYDHQAWMQLRSAFDTLLAQVADIAGKAPAALDSLARLKDNPDDGGDFGEAWLQESAHGMQDRFQQVTASLGLEATAERVAELLAACKEPANHPETRPLTGNSLLQPYIEGLERLRTRLDELRQLLQDRWKQAEAGLLVDGRLNDYRRAVVELGDWLERWGKDAAKRVDTRVIANQQMAEDAKEKMRIQVLEPSAARLVECRTLTSKLRRLVAALPPGVGGGESHEATRLVDELEVKLKNFNERIKLANEKLIRICAFFGGCAGLLKWYRRCMHKLPLDLLQPQRHSRLQSNDLLPIVSKWPDVAKSFLHKYPSPTRAQLNDITDSMTLIDNSEIRKESQLLLYRTNLLRKLFFWDQSKISDGLTVAEFRELLDNRDREVESDGDPAFVALEPSQSLAGSSSEEELEASPAVPLKAAANSFMFPPDRDESSERDLQRGGRYRRRTERSMASSSRSGTEIVEVISQPIVINHRLMMSRPPARGIELFDEERPKARKGVEDAISRQAVTTIESQPKEETVRRFLENMVTPPPPPLTATTDDSLGSGSRTGRSLSNLVGELRELKDALFSGSNRAPVARRGRRAAQPHRPAQRQRLPAAMAGELLRSRSEQNLTSHPAGGYSAGDPVGRRQHKLLLLQLDEPPSTRGVAYPVEVVDIERIIGDIHDIASDRYKLEHQNQYSSRLRLISGGAAAAGYSMSRMSDTDHVASDYSRDNLLDDEEFIRELRPSRHSDNFLLQNSSDGRTAGGRSQSPRSLLMMSPLPPPSIPEEAVNAAEAASAAERFRWRRRDNRVWLHNSYKNH